jgi:hypothetical protein
MREKKFYLFLMSSFSYIRTHKVFSFPVVLLVANRHVEYHITFGHQKRLYANGTVPVHHGTNDFFRVKSTREEDTVLLLSAVNRFNIMSYCYSGCVSPYEERYSLASDFIARFEARSSDVDDGAAQHVATFGCEDQRQIRTGYKSSHG